MFHTHNKARIIKLIIEEAPMMETQFHRPLIAQPVNDLMIGNIAANIQANNGQINTGMLSTVVNGIALPSAAPEAINNQLIPANVAGGWHQQRLKFILRVAVDLGMSQEVIECYSGYTDRKDITMQTGQLADDMLFVINSGWVEQVVRSTIGGGDRTVMRNTTNILSNTNYNSLLDKDPTNMVTKIRPVDAFSMMSNAPAMSSGVVDATNIGLVSRSPTPSSTDNNVISNYLNRVFDGYVNAVAQTAMRNDMQDEPGFENMMGSKRDNLYTMAASFTPEVGLPTALRFTMMLGMNRSGSPVGADSFTMRDLRMIDPMVVNNIDYFRNSHSFTSMLSIPSDNFNNWAGAGANEQVAAHMSNIVPALMYRYGINSVGGRITNRTIGNITDVSVGRLVLTAGDVATTQLCTEMFKKDVVAEGIVPVTMLGNHQRDFDIYFSATLGGEMELLIALDGEPSLTPYRTPLFCNSVTAPVFGRDLGKANVFANTLESIIQSAILPVHQLTANIGGGNVLAAVGLAPSHTAASMGGFDIGSPQVVKADLHNQPY